MEQHFFSPDLLMKFKWNTLDLQAGSIHVANRKQISDGLKELSSESIRNRFLGSKSSFSEKELSYLTQLDGINHYAFGVEDQKLPERGIGIIRIVRSSHISNEAEVAITIIDEFQKMGLGTLLVECIILAALERKINKLFFSFRRQNTGIIKLIAKIGKSTLEEESKDDLRVSLDLNSVALDQIKDHFNVIFGQSNLSEIGMGYKIERSSSLVKAL